MSHGHGAGGVASAVALQLLCEGQMDGTYSVGHGGLMDPTKPYTSDTA
jgi:hypothetical protein